MLVSSDQRSGSARLIFSSCRNRAYLACIGKNLGKHEVSSQVHPDSLVHMKLNSQRSPSYKEWSNFLTPKLVRWIVLEVEFTGQ